MMNNFFVLTAEFWITILLIAGTLKYWGSKLQKEQLLKSTNKAYALFLFSQISAVLMIVFLGIDSQNYAYLEGLSILGEDAGSYWAYFSIEVFSFMLIYVLTLLFSFFIYKVFIPSNKELKEEIYEDNWGPVLVFNGVQLALVIVVSSFVLRTFLFDWVTGLRTAIPMFN